MDTMEMRRNAIAELVNKHGTVSFAQIKEQFPQVSEMTLRTDLKALDAAKEIVRIHGGAKSVQLVIGTDDYLTRRAVRNIQSKQEIAKKAVQLVLPDTVIFLDSGSTTTELARIFPDQSNLIYTTGLSCATELAARWTAESLQHQYVRYLSHPGTGAGELSSDIFRGNRVFDESRVYLWKQ